MSSPPPDFHHRNTISQANGTSRFHLSGIDGQDAAPHHFGNIGAAVQAEYQDAYVQGGQVDTQQWKYDIIHDQ
jgi:hypothetical protein